MPGRRGAGTRIDTRVRLADVAPTLLEAAGLPVPPAMQGESLMPLVSQKLSRAAAASGPSPIVPSTPKPSIRAARSAGVRWPRGATTAFCSSARRSPSCTTWSPIRTPRRTSPRRGRASLDGMSAELREFLVRSSGSGEPGGSVGRRAVGPCEGGTSGSGAGETARRARLRQRRRTPPSAPAWIPKDRIAIANALHQAVVAVEDGAFQKAIPLLEKVTASEPDIPLAQLQLGIARVRLKQYARAIPPLTKAVSLDPDQLFGQYELGIALYETGDLQGAARHFAIVAGKMPGWADARYSLGSVYARIDRVAEATTELRAALALEPRHFRANLLLGRILTLQNQADAAIPLLRTAVEVDPKSTEAKAFLEEALKRK